MFKKFLASVATLLVAVSLSLVGVAGSAAAAGSDSQTPYAVGATGITLPSGAVFKDNQEINIHSTPSGTGVHLEAKCVTRTDAECAGDRHTLAQYIGASFIPWSAFHLTGSFCVSWVQVGGFNEHFGEGGQAPLCTTPPTVGDAAAAAPSIVAATCATGQTLALGSATNASWGAVTGGTGPGSYSVTATATSGHTFSDGSTTKAFTGTLAGPLSPYNAACQAPPNCIPDSSVSYGYTPGTNSGDIVVTDIKNSTGTLCHPFWVTATSWLYTQNAIWPQVLDVVQKLPKISAPGTYHYGATVTCGQGDIYASTVAQPEPTSVLNGPNNPFSEHFLHDMGFSGPTPTYVQQPTACNVITPVAPTATAIAACGQYGSVTVPASTAAVTYSETGSGNQGDYVVTVTVNAPYTLKTGATASWTFHLGHYAPCAAPCATTTAGPLSTNLDNAGWTFGESKSGGHHEYLASGLHIWTDGSGSTDKSAGYHATDFPLSQVGAPALGYANNSGQSAPGLQLTVFVNGAFFGNLVDEPLFAKWWSSHPVTGLPSGPNPGYQLSYGSIDDYLFAWAQQGITDVQVKAIGYSLGSGAKGDGIVTSVTAGCVNYAFTAKSYAPSVSYTLGACYPNTGFSSKNLYFHFDNSASDVPVTFTVAYTGISDTVAAHSTDTVEGTPIWDQGGGYDVSADGVLLSHLTIPAFEGCLTSIPGDPSVSPAVCTNGVVGDGSITVDLQSGLTYSITGVGNPVSIPEVTSSVTKLPAGTYRVDVAAKPGFVLTGADSWPLTETVLPPLDCIPTLADQPTNATAQDEVCGSSGSGGGSITVGQVGGVDFSKVVDYFIDGVPVTQTTTPLAAGTYTVTAKPQGKDGLDGPSSWVLTIHAASTECGDLKTLALTGIDDRGWIVLAVILLQLGVGALAVRAALTRRRAAQHRA